MKKWIEKNRVDLVLYLGFIGVLVLLIILAVAPGYKTAVNTNSAYNPTAIAFGSFMEIQWYAIFILTGIVLGTVMAIYEVKRFGWKTDDLLDGLLIIAPLAIIGARLYYVLFDPAGKPSSFRDVIAIWEGGLAIHGAIIIAVIGITIFSRIKKINVFALADILAIGLLMGQITGRWGNFMNAEAHGAATSSPFLIKILPNFITHQMSFSSHMQNLTGSIYLPTFLFESLWNFLGLTLLLILRRTKTLKVGDMLGIYLIWYGFGRGVLIEPFRTDQLRPILGVPVNILLSLILFVGGGIIYLILKRVYFKDEKKYYEILVNDVDLLNRVVNTND